MARRRYAAALLAALNLPTCRRYAAYFPARLDATDPLPLRG